MSPARFPPPDEPGDPTPHRVEGTGKVSTISTNTTPGNQGTHTPGRSRTRWFRRRRPRSSTAPGSTPATPPPERPQVEPEPATGEYRFGPLSVSYDLACALQKVAYEHPTPIQERCIPSLKAGKDLVGQAQTGTGKTAAFGIPLIEGMDPSQAHVQGLVLTPTRELAVQVSRELARLGRFRGLAVLACYGGEPIRKQIDALERGAHIVVGTPGRVLDHLGRGTLSLGNVRCAVLDEADEMLDIGFLPDVERILSTTPGERQTALFSATMPIPIRRIVHRHMRAPVWVRIGEEISTVPEVRQVYYEVWERDRLLALHEILNTQVNGGKALLFRRTQVGVERLVRSLERGHSVAGIHGGMTQSHRTAAMAAFRAGKLKVLVATNVAARGLDIPEVSHVVNFDMPENVEEYVHRIGRTARMGNDGTAITFVTEWTFDMLDTLQAHPGIELEQGSLAMYD